MRHIMTGHHYLLQKEDYAEFFVGLSSDKIVDNSHCMISRVILRFDQLIYCLLFQIIGPLDRI